eukprot:782211-Ditylum_brightwellii.AAC.1
MEYTVKRSGQLAQKEGKNKKKKSCKRKKSDCTSDSNDYEDKSTRPKVKKSPSYITMIEHATQKHIDFKIMASMLL